MNNSANLMFLEQRVDIQNLPCLCIFLIDVGIRKKIRPKTRRFTAQKLKFPVKDFLSKSDQIHRKLRIWSHLLKKSLMENFIFCAVIFLEDVNTETHKNLKKL